MINIHAEKAPARGNAILETIIPTDVTLKTPLSVRLAAKLVEDRLVSEELRDKFEGCFDEALINCILHGNREDPKLSVTAGIYRDGDQWFVQISDEGSGFTAEQIPDPEDPEFPFREHGRGIYLMNHFVESIEYFSGGRTVVISGHAGYAVSPQDSVERSPESGLEMTEAHDVVIARLSPDSAEGSFASAVDEIVSAVKSKPRAVVLDMSKVHYVSSRGIGCLVRLYRNCLRVGRGFAIAEITTELAELLSLMRLDTIFSLHDSVENAVEAVRGEVRSSHDSAGRVVSR